MHKVKNALVLLYACEFLLKKYIILEKLVLNHAIAFHFKDVVFLF